jgi:hypothetical protein
LGQADLALPTDKSTLRGVEHQAVKPRSGGSCPGSFIESSKTLLPFADELRFKLSGSIPRYIDLELSTLAQERLFAAAVAIVFAARWPSTCAGAAPFP